MHRHLLLCGIVGLFGCGPSYTESEKVTDSLQQGVKGDNNGNEKIEHVAMFVLDGFHQFDLENYAKSHPSSALARLVARGIMYTNATAVAPSDSFPTTLAALTGGNPSSTGVYYDTQYDENLSAPGSNCSTRGTVVSYKENINCTACTGG